MAFACTMVHLFCIIIMGDYMKRGIYRDNKLWESHRFFLPELRDKLVLCRECYFHVTIKGREESRPGCVVGIEDYATLKKRVPKVISGLELLRSVGKEGLQEIIKRGSEPDKNACGLYRPTGDVKVR